MMPVLENSKIFVLDNGGGQLKAGHSNMPSPRIIPNCVTKAKSEKRRAFIGDQLDDCRDLSGLFYMLPFQKGKSVTKFIDIYLNLSLFLTSVPVRFLSWFLLELLIISIFSFTKGSK